MIGSFSTGGSVPTAATLTASLEREIRSLLDQGKRIAAIKVYREHTGSSLKDVKPAVEALQRGASSPQPAKTNTALQAEGLRLVVKNEKILKQ